MLLPGSLLGVCSSNSDLLTASIVLVERAGENVAGVLDASKTEVALPHADKMMDVAGIRWG